ncbi:MAG: 5'/3'-nucleotidase SurE [Sphingomonadales bacterium]|nr:5'/3'-nucleotidase SurE [Sphingomonadales bacterium]
MSQPLILVCNDDGIHAPGIRALVEAVEPLGDVVVVAPDQPQSGMGHAVTIGEPLRIFQKSGLFGRHDAYETTGTPVDCVKLAVDRILHRKPDLLVSGINHGSNSSINVIYSGTMSAAVEGAIEGIPSVGFSLCSYATDADFSLAGRVATQITQLIMENGLIPNTLLNVNIPNIPGDEYKGLKVCRQSAAKWRENFEERVDPYRKKYYWMVGEFQLLEHSTDTDEWALANQYASVVPVQFDMTAHHAIPFLNQWKLEG